MTKRERRRKSPDGLPIDKNEWTEADWRDLYEAMERVKRLISKRHQGETMHTTLGRPLQIALREAVKSPNSWDTAGLLSDAADNLDEFEAFVRSLLNPEKNGMAVNAYVRDRARELLGMAMTETKGK